MKNIFKFLLFFTFILKSLVLDGVAMESPDPNDDQREQSSQIQRKFFEMDAEEYRTYIQEFSNLENNNAKANKILEWSLKADVPILALTKHSLFFYANLHAYSPDKAPAIDFDDKSSEGIEGKFTTYFFDDHIEVEDRRPLKVQLKKDYKKPKIPKQITEDLKSSALCYLNKAKYNTFFDESHINTELDDFFNVYPFKLNAIALDFLTGYTISIHEIGYLNQIIQGLILLPKSVVEMLSGKALYFSNAKGTSRTIITSQCQLIVSYLGLMPGVFMERHKDRQQITETLIHEIGHIIDHTVLQPFYSSKEKRSIRFYHQFEAVQKLYVQRDKYFKGNLDYKENKKNDRVKGNIGFVTNYSEKNREEDFAEHFVHFVMHKEKFKEKVQEELKLESSVLSEKFEFMKTLIEDTPTNYTIYTK